MKYGIQPFGAAISGIKWKSSDKKIVTVDESGTIHVVADKPGSLHGDSQGKSV